MSDVGTPVTLAQVLEASGRTLKASIHTGVPAEVVLYDPITNTCQAKIVVDEFYFDETDAREYDELPIIPFVPVMWPRGGGKTVRWLLEPGDFVWLAFSEKSLAEWRTSGQRSQPVDARRHSLGWPVAYPGGFPDVQPMSPIDALEIIAGGMIIGDDGGANQIRIGGTTPGVKIASSGVEPVSPIALSVPTDAGLAAMATAINAVIATLNALVAVHNSHTHSVSGVTAGAASVTSAATTSTASAAAPGPPAPGTTASTKTRSL